MIPKVIEQRIRSAERIWWFLDYDGTLNDFAPTPEDITPNPEVTRLLQRLASAAGQRVTILSGRPLWALQRLIPVSGVELAGTYGWEVSSPNQEVRFAEEQAHLRPVLEALVPRLADLLDGRSGFYLEDKGCALALHARFASQEDARRVLAEAERRFRLASSGLPFVVELDDRFLEIYPSAARKKEFIRLALAGEPQPLPLLVYIGDDARDEEAFSAVQENGGIALRVVHRPVETQADGTFHAPEEVRSFLSSVATRSSNTP